MHSKTISNGTYFNSEFIRSTFVVDDKLTIAIHSDQIDGNDPTNCVYGKTLACICISIYPTLLLQNTK